MKKILALVLAFAMMFSTITVAFAEPEVSAEAKALATIGMLQGTGDGVTAEYTATELNRLTAASMILKLKGLYEEATKYDGVNNFADAESVAWPEGKKLLAFVKDNPIGFGGNEKGEFDPNGTLSEQMLYKVLLENLGYKQNVGEVVGDFAWEETLTFAESIGLKPAKAEKFTVDGLSKAVVAALKTNMKGGKAWIDVLVEAGKVDKEKAVAADLMAESKAVAVAVKSVKAIGNTVVEVEYKEAVEKDAAENLDNYAIEGLEVKAAVLDGTKKVLLETEAQKAGTKYTLTVNDAKFNFGGISKIVGAPVIDKAEGPDTERVKLTFNKVLDVASALEVANYEIANVTVNSAKLSSDRKVVTLTTEGLVANKTYSVKVKDVKSVDGVAIKSVSKTFLSKSDKIAPKVDSVVSDTNTRLIVTFNEPVTEESAQDLANYSIKSGTTEIAIENAELIADANDDMTIVELTTAEQKTGTRYTLYVNNITDISVLENKITKEVSKTYYAKSLDTSAPSFKTFEYMTNSLVKVTFTDSSRLLKESVLDVNNYTFNNDVTVDKVELFDEDDRTNTVVKLTVSELGEKTSYELKVAGIKDEYENEMKEKKMSKTFNRAEVAKAATVERAYASKTNEVKVVFTKEVTKATATDVANYLINGDINTPLTASLNATAKIVTLKTEGLKAGKAYTITINGVTDLAGNVIANAKPGFVGLAEGNDIEAPTIESVEALNNKVVRVTFSEPMKVIPAPQITVGASTGTYAVSADDDDTVLEFTMAPAFSADADVKLTATTAVDKAGNKCDLPTGGFEFSAIKDVPEDIELLSWEQVDVRKFKLIFSDKVEVLTAAVATTPYALTAESDADDATVVYLKSDQRMAADKTFKIVLKGKIVGLHGIAIKDPDKDGSNSVTILETGIEDTDAPYLVDVVTVNRKKVKLVFNEDLKTVGTYEVKYTDSKGKDQVWSQTAAPDSDDATLVYLTSGTDLDSRYVYTITVKTQAQDYSYNKLDKETTFEFPGTDTVEVANYVKGVQLLNGTTINVLLNKAIDKVKIVDAGDANVNKVKQGNIELALEKATKTDGTALVAGKTYSSYQVILTDDVLKADVTYKVVVDGMEYEFEGIVESGMTVEIDDSTPTTIYVTYAEAAEGDKIFVNGVDKTASATKDGDRFTVLTAYAGGGSLYSVVVKRDGVTLYTYENDENNAAAAKEVTDAIAALPAVADIAIGNKAVIDAARSAYDGLPTVQKVLVTNLATLEAAEAKIAVLEADKDIEDAKALVVDIKVANEDNLIEKLDALAGMAATGVELSVKAAVTGAKEAVVAADGAVTEGTEEDVLAVTIVITKAPGTAVEKVINVTVEVTP